MTPDLTSVDPIPSEAPAKRFWITFLYHANGYQATYFEKSMVNVRILASMVAPYADVVSFGECER